MSEFIVARGDGTIVFDFVEEPLNKISLAIEREIAIPLRGGIMSTEFAGLCGIAFCIGAGAALYLENSHFWTTEAIAAIEDKPQVVNRLRKDDRLRATMIDPSIRSADPHDGFGMLEVGGPLNATITIRDASGRLVFELDLLNRSTVTSKRGARGAPPSKDQGGQTAPKSRVVPVNGPGECDRPRSCLVASGLLQLVEEFHSHVQSDTKRQASLVTLAQER